VVFTFNSYLARLSESYWPNLRYIAPVHVNGPVAFNLLAVWAQMPAVGLCANISWDRSGTPFLAIAWCCA